MGSTLGGEPGCLLCGEGIVLGLNIPVGGRHGYLVSAPEGQRPHGWAPGSSGQRREAGHTGVEWEDSFAPREHPPGTPATEQAFVMWPADAGPPRRRCTRHMTREGRGEAAMSPRCGSPLPGSEVASASVVTEARAGPGVRTAPRGGQPAPRGPVCHTGPLPSWKGRRFVPRGSDVFGVGLPLVLPPAPRGATSGQRLSE